MSGPVNIVARNNRSGNTISGELFTFLGGRATEGRSSIPPPAPVISFSKIILIVELTGIESRGLFRHCAVSCAHGYRQCEPCYEVGKPVPNLASLSDSLTGSGKS